MKAWLVSKKEDIYAVVTITGLLFLLIVAAPYCC